MEDGEKRKRMDDFLTASPNRNGCQVSNSPEIEIRTPTTRTEKARTRTSTIMEHQQQQTLQSKDYNSPATKQSRRNGSTNAAMDDDDSRTGEWPVTRETIPWRNNAGPKTLRLSFVSLLSEDDKDDDDDDDHNNNSGKHSKVPSKRIVSSFSQNKKRTNAKVNNQRTAPHRSAKKTKSIPNHRKNTFRGKSNSSITSKGNKTRVEDVQDTLENWLAKSDSQSNTDVSNANRSLTDTTTSIQILNLSPEQLHHLNETAIERALRGPVPVDSTYSIDEFRAMMQKASSSSSTTDSCIPQFSLDLDVLEASRAVRKANQTVERSDSTFQTRAQYGRTMITCGEFLLGTIGKLGKDKVFCDIGHGIGNLPIQAAFTHGCESRGIEMVGDRHAIAECLNEFFHTQHKLVSDQSGEIRTIGNVRLRHGNLEDRVHREFLTDGVDLLYCNNYNGVFHARANERSVDWCLDDYIAGLFTQLKEGAKLVTLYAIQRLPLPLKEANEVRVKNGSLPSDAASFYTLETITDPGGEDKLSFTQKSFTYYVYTRVGPLATFTCPHKSCRHYDIPILAFETIIMGQSSSSSSSLSSFQSNGNRGTLPPSGGNANRERLVPVTACPECGEKRTTRRRGC